ncbi:hypothetical protein, partial [Klebsiella pneumoniae]|uniref:hypothetical protein n=1 Tax=Klebsiella pneumoniae TaxID=573 RepID=UPI001954EED3
PDLPGVQTIKTYWLDVMEYQTLKPNNQFYLAAMYGGFTPPDNFNANTVTAAQFAQNKSWWATTTDVLPDGSQRPDNFFTAGQA